MSRPPTGSSVPMDEKVVSVLVEQKRETGELRVRSLTHSPTEVFSAHPDWQIFEDWSTLVRYTKTRPSMLFEAFLKRSTELEQDAIQSGINKDVTTSVVLDSLQEHRFLHQEALHWFRQMKLDSQGVDDGNLDDRVLKRMDYIKACTLLGRMYSRTFNHPDIIPPKEEEKYKDTAIGAWDVKLSQPLSPGIKEKFMKETEDASDSRVDTFVIATEQFDGIRTVLHTHLGPRISGEIMADDDDGTSPTYPRSTEHPDFITPATAKSLPESQVHTLSQAFKTYLEACLEHSELLEPSEKLVQEVGKKFLTQMAKLSRDIGKVIEGRADAIELSPAVDSGNGDQLRRKLKLYEACRSFVGPSLELENLIGIHDQQEAAGEDHQSVTLTRKIEGAKSAYSNWVRRIKGRGGPKKYKRPPTQPDNSWGPGQGGSPEASRHQKNSSISTSASSNPSAIVLGKGQKVGLKQAMTGSEIQDHAGGRRRPGKRPDESNTKSVPTTRAPLVMDSMFPGCKASPPNAPISIHNSTTQRSDSPHSPQRTGSVPSLPDVAHPGLPAADTRPSDKLTKDLGGLGLEERRLVDPRPGEDEAIGPQGCTRNQAFTVPGAQSPGLRPSPQEPGWTEKPSLSAARSDFDAPSSDSGQGWTIVSLKRKSRKGLGPPTGSTTTYGSKRGRGPLTQSSKGTSTNTRGSKVEEKRLDGQGRHLSSRAYSAALGCPLESSKPQSKQPPGMQKKARSDLVPSDDPQAPPFLVDPVVPSSSRITSPAPDPDPGATAWFNTQESHSLDLDQERRGPLGNGRSTSRYPRSTSAPPRIMFTADCSGDCRSLNSGQFGDETTSFEEERLPPYSVRNTSEGIAPPELPTSSTHTLTEPGSPAGLRRSMTSSHGTAPGISTTATLQPTHYGPVIQDWPFHPSLFTPLTVRSSAEQSPGYHSPWYPNYHTNPLEGWPVPTEVPFVEFADRRGYPPSFVPSYPGHVVRFPASQGPAFFDDATFHPPVTQLHSAYGLYGPSTTLHSFAPYTPWIFPQAALSPFSLQPDGSMLGNPIPYIPTNAPPLHPVSYTVPSIVTHYSPTQDPNHSNPRHPYHRYSSENANHQSQ